MVVVVVVVGGGGGWGVDLSVVLYFNIIMSFTEKFERV